MKRQSLFSEENKKNIINLSSAEFAQRVVQVNENGNWEEQNCIQVINTTLNNYDILLNIYQTMLQKRF